MRLGEGLVCEVRLVVLFGGVGNGSYFSDTWAWDGGGWTKVA